MAERQSGPRLAVALREPLPWPELLGLVRTAEETGYEAVFVPEVGHREAFSQLAAMATSTSRLRLASGVVSLESRTPQATAAAALTVHELSGGRHVLGVGAGHRSLSELLAYDSQLRQALTAHALGPAPPVWFAALGDRVVEAAAERADGVLLNWCTPERVADAVQAVRRRDPQRPFTVGVYVRCCLTGVADDAPLEALRLAAATYASLPHYRRQFEAMGLGDGAAAAARALADGDVTAVPESFVDALCVRGGRDAFRERALAFARAGADVVVVYPVAARDAASSLLATLLAAAPDPAVER